MFYAQIHEGIKILLPMTEGFKRTIKSINCFFYLQLSANEIGASEMKFNSKKFLSMAIKKMNAKHFCENFITFLMLPKLILLKLFFFCSQSQIILSEHF